FVSARGRHRDQRCTRGQRLELREAVVLLARRVDEQPRPAERVAELAGVEQAAPLDARRLLDLALLEPVARAIALDAGHAQTLSHHEPDGVPRLDQDVEAALLRIAGVRE